jgi:hypothetical protein
MQAIMRIKDQLTSDPTNIAGAVVATRTGGFLGIGACSVVNEQEPAALAELEATLEISS